MAYTKGIKITDGDLGEDYACGKCGTVMYGDEVICTRCKTLNTFSPPIQMDSDYVCNIYLAYEHKRG